MAYQSNLPLDISSSDTSSDGEDERQTTPDGSEGTLAPDGGSTSGGLDRTSEFEQFQTHTPSASGSAGSTHLSQESGPVTQNITFAKKASGGVQAGIIYGGVNFGSRSGHRSKRSAHAQKGGNAPYGSRRRGERASQSAKRSEDEEAERQGGAESSAFARGQTDFSAIASGAEGTTLTGVEANESEGVQANVITLEEGTPHFVRGGSFHATNEKVAPSFAEYGAGQKKAAGKGKERGDYT